MGTKFYLKFLYLSNTVITNYSNYFELDLDLNHFQDIHIVTKLLLMINIAMSANLLFPNKLTILYMLHFNITTLWLSHTIFDF